MPPTISLTNRELRQRIASGQNDNVVFTCASGGTTSLTCSVDSDYRLALPNFLVGSEVYATSGTGSGQTTQCTAHTVSGSTATLTFTTVTTGFDSTTVVELHNISGRGYRTAQYNNAINATIDMVADREFTDYSVVPFSVEMGYGSGAQTPIGVRKKNYPMPSGFNYLWGVDLLSPAPVTRSGIGGLTGTQAFGAASANTKVAQSFQVVQPILLGYICVYMSTFGSPTDNITMTVESDNNGAPSGTPISNGTATVVPYTALNANLGFILFQFPSTCFLTQGVTYHWVLTRSGSNSASNYYSMGINGNGTYGYGNAELYDGATWTQQTSDFLFAVSVTGSQWISLAPRFWEYRPGSADKLWLNVIDMAYEGTPIQLRGGAAISQPATDSTTIPIRPEWAERVATVFLTGNKAGKPDASNNAQSMQAQLQQLGLYPPPYRSLPTNSVRIYT